MTYVERVSAAGGTPAEIILAEGMDAILGGRVRPRAAVPKQECATPVKTEESSDVRRVFEAWQTIAQRSGAKLTKERRRAIQSRLNDGYAPERIIRAIQGCAGSDFHMARGQYAGQQQYNDLTLICRNGSKLEEFERRPIPVERDVVLLALRKAAQINPSPDQAYQAVNGALPPKSRMGNHKNEAYRLLRAAGMDVRKAVELREQEISNAGA